MEHKEKSSKYIMKKRVQFDHDKDQIDPFFFIRKGDMNQIKEQLEKTTININVTRWSGFTLLHRAAEIGHNELCEYLIERGISPNTRCARGWYTPVHIALANGHIDTAEILISKGGNPWLKSKYKEDAFQYGNKRGFVKIVDEFRMKVIKNDMQESLKRNQLFTTGKDIMVANKEKKERKSLLLSEEKAEEIN